MKKKTLHASHHKRHLAATAKPVVREPLERLRADWNDLNYVQRGDRLIQLQSAGCSVRGLAHDLGVDDGTVRRAIEIARHPEPDRRAIEAGADAKSFLEAARARCLLEAAHEKDGARDNRWNSQRRPTQQTRMVHNDRVA